MTKILLFFIDIYRIFFSALLGQNCRYTPTCSQYAKDALKMHGFFRGSFITVKRLFRCHPWGGYGYDPVKISKMSEKKDS